MNPLKKLVKKKRSTESALQSLGRSARKGYQKSWAKWESSPRHKKIQENIKYSG